MKTLRHRMKIYTAWMFLAMPASAQANIGVPMLFVTLPAMTIALLPIILIEAALALRYLRLPFRTLLKTSAIANLVSTFVGIPLVWTVLVVLQMGTGGGAAHGLETPFQKILAVTWQAPWLIPYDIQLNWMIPVAMLVLFIPFFFASWWIEYRVAMKILRDSDKSRIRKAVRNANFVSYTALAFFVALQMHWGLIGV